MSTQIRRISVPPGSELATLLDEAAAAPVLLEKDGLLYRLAVEENIWAGYEPERVRETIARTAGSWSNVDVDTTIDELYRAREEGSRPQT